MAKNSVAATPEGWDAPPNVTEVYRREGGAGWARGYIMRTRNNEPNTRNLAFYVDGAREIIFKDDPVQQDEFFKTLRDAIVECRTEIVTAPDARLSSIDQVLCHLDDATTFIHAICNLAKQQICDGDDDTDTTGLSIKALAEKAGYLCDECIRAISGGPGCVGNFDDWAEVKIPEAPEDEAAVRVR